MTTPITTMTTTEITGDARMTFLPQLFTEQTYLYGERAVFEWLRRLCDTYHGGYWEYHAVSNGAYFMAPARSEPMRLQWALNWSNETMSPRAAGIVATLYGLSQLLESFPQEEVLRARYHLLRDYADELPECGPINRLIN